VSSMRGARQGGTVRTAVGGGGWRRLAAVGGGWRRLAAAPEGGWWRPRWPAVAGGGRWWPVVSGCGLSEATRAAQCGLFQCPHDRPVAFSVQTAQFVALWCRIGIGSRRERPTAPRTAVDEALVRAGYLPGLGPTTSGDLSRSGRPAPAPLHKSVESQSHRWSWSSTPLRRRHKPSIARPAGYLASPSGNRR